MEIIVKIDPKRVSDPVAHVRRLLDGTLDSKMRVEEVFPGVRTGHSACLISVTLAVDPGSSEHASVVRALRDDAGVVYVDDPKRRRPG